MDQSVHSALQVFHGDGRPEVREKHQSSSLAAHFAPDWRHPKPMANRFGAGRKTKREPSLGFFRVF
ncbi:hypothetical protein UCMB321_1251 [Pseudomonas batumici]|uniref:Uncharacterized protein n=1 Tax=Pseudomonas batumici TaxID=226910 RepID=A0A0C2F1K6_9PSED|nr:hypothetical protein UCMB321_1251 [Pseudomonas batumici]